MMNLQRMDIDLADGDYIIVRDGGDASAPLLGRYSGRTGPLHILSTGPQLYILMKTHANIDLTNRGFQFRYSTGVCVCVHAFLHVYVHGLLTFFLICFSVFGCYCCFVISCYQFVQSL